MLVPLLVIAAGIGVGALGWLYGRLAGRERDLAQGIRGLSDGIESTRRRIDEGLAATVAASEEAAGRVADSRVAPYASALAALRTSVERAAPDLERLGGEVGRLATDVRGLEQRLGEEIASRPRDVATKESVDGMRQGLAALLQRVESLEKRVVAAETAARATNTVVVPSPSARATPARPASIATLTATSPAPTATPTSPSSSPASPPSESAPPSTHIPEPAPTVQPHAPTTERRLNWLLILLALFLAIAALANYLGN